MKQPLALALASAFVMSVALPSHAQSGAGKPFGSRDPRPCAPTKASGKGPPSEDIVTKAVLCSTEKISSQMLYLTQDLKIDIASKGRPYNPRNDLMSEIDVDVPVYSIRGSYVQYQCAPISTILQNQGKNCNIYRQPNAAGTCYKTTFGDWKCGLSDLNSKQEPGNPPPK